MKFVKGSKTYFTKSGVRKGPMQYYRDCNGLKLFIVERGDGEAWTESGVCRGRHQNPEFDNLVPPRPPKTLEDFS